MRERGEPIRLFGETDYDAFQRLRKIEILTPEVNKVMSQNKARKNITVPRKLESVEFDRGGLIALLYAKMEKVARLLPNVFSF